MNNIFITVNACHYSMITKTPIILALIYSSFHSCSTIGWYTLGYLFGTITLTDICMENMQIERNMKISIAFILQILKQCIHSLIKLYEDCSCNSQNKATMQICI